MDPVTLRHAIRVVRILRDPALPGTVLFTTVTAVGFVTLALTVLALTNASLVAMQTPYLVTGGIGGLGLAGIGALLVLVHTERRDRASAHAEREELIGVLAEVRSVVRRSVR